MNESSWIKMLEEIKSASAYALAARNAIPDTDENAKDREMLMETMHHLMAATSFAERITVTGK